jgi:cell division septation protein DedD
LPKQEKFAVIAGPFQSKQEANSVKTRIKKTFDLKSELIVPH